MNGEHKVYLQIFTPLQLDVLTKRILVKHVVGHREKVGEVLWLWSRVHDYVSIPSTVPSTYCGRL